MACLDLALGQWALKLRPWEWLALLLLPDPVGLRGMSFSWMTGCSFDTLTLGILSGGGTDGGSAVCGSLGAWLLP